MCMGCSRGRVVKSEKLVELTEFFRFAQEFLEEIEHDRLGMHG